MQSSSFEKHVTPQQGSDSIRVIHAALHSDLRNESLHENLSEVPTSLRSIVMNYAKTRGAILAAENPDYASVIGLDRYMRCIILENRERIASTPGLLAVMEYSARVTQETVFLQNIAQTVSELAEQRGHKFASYRDHSAYIAELSAKIDELISRSDQKEYLHKKVEEAERHGIKSVLRCEKLAAESMRNIYTFKKDPEKIAQTLEKMSLHERQMFQETFEGRYKCNLTAEIRTHFNGPARARILQLLQGNDIAARAYELFGVMRGFSFGKPAKIAEILSKIAPQDKIQFERNFMRRFDKFLETSSFEAVLDRYAGKKENRHRIDYIREGKTEHAEVYRIRNLLTKHNIFTRSGNLVSVIEALSAYDKKQLFDFQYLYNEEHKVTFAEDIKKTRIPVEYKDCLNAIISFDKFTVDLTKLRCALSGIRTVWLGEIALNNSPEYLKQLINAYERKYSRDFEHDFRVITQTRLAPIRFVFGDEYEAIKNMFTNGRLSNAELMGHCLFGPGTDEEGVKKIIEGMGCKEVEQLKIEYAGRFEGRDLENDLLWELSGDDKFDIFEMMKGEPTTPEELMQRIEGRYFYELNGPLAQRVQRIVSQTGKSLSKRFQVVRKLIYQYEWEGDRLSEDYENIVLFYNTHLKDMLHTPDNLRRFDVLAQRLLLSAAGFRQAENAIIEHVTHNTASITAAVTFPVTAFLTHSLVATISAGVIVNLATRVALKTSLKGVAYGHEEIIADSLRASIAGSNLLAGRINARQLAQRVTGTVTKMGLGKLVNVTEKVKKKSQHTQTSFILREAMASVKNEARDSLLLNGDYEIPASMRAINSFAAVWKEIN